MEEWSPNMGMKKGRDKYPQSRIDPGKPCRGLKLFNESNRVPKLSKVSQHSHQ